MGQLLGEQHFLFNNIGGIIYEEICKFVIKCTSDMKNKTNNFSQYIFFSTYSSFGQGYPFWPAKITNNDTESCHIVTKYDVLSLQQIIKLL